MRDYNAGRYDAALAVQKAQQLGWDTREMHERLSAYRHHTAWRGDLLPLPPLSERRAS